MLHQELESTRLQQAYNRVLREDRYSINSDDSYYTNRELDHYDRQLPRYNGKTFLETLRSKIAETTQPIEVLDIGCGQGRALAQLLRDFPGKLRVSGIAATDLREYSPSELQPFASQIDMHVGDAHNIKQIFDQRRFDYIISVKTFEHLEYPEKVAQQCIELLKPEGLAFIEGLHFDKVLPQRQIGMVA